MPFSTQGNTNWKFLLIVVVLAVIVGVGILAYLQTIEVVEGPVVEELPVEKPVINPVAEYFEGAELQYEGDDQKENIVTSLNDILSLSEEELQQRRYKDYEGKENQWDLPTLIYRHFVPMPPGTTLGDNFFSDVKKEEAQEQVRQILEKYFEETDKTAGWQAYKNELYKFEVKYPSGWEKYKMGWKEYELIREESDGLFSIGFTEPRPDSPEGIFMQGVFNIEILRNPDGLSFERWMKQYKREAPTGANLIQGITDTTLDGIIAKRVSVFGFDGTIIEIITTNKGLIYKLSFSDPVTPDQSTHDTPRYRQAYEQNYRHQQIYNQMLSTFRFTEKDQMQCISDEDCIIFGDENNDNCGCFNKDSQWEPREFKVAEHKCLVPTHCRCINGACGVVVKDTGELAEFDLVYIRKIYTENEKEYLDIDYIEWVGCDGGYNSECARPNGYIIMNYEPEIETFEISRDVDIRMCSPSHYAIWDEEIAYKRFKELLIEHSYYTMGMGGIPFLIKVQNEKIIKIKEVYIP